MNSSVSTEQMFLNKEEDLSVGMDRHGLVEHIRRQILNDENKVNSRKSHGVEKIANKTRKFRITCHEIPSAKNTFEENVLRKAQSIRTSVAFKQCCRRLSGYEDENVGIITKPYKSMPSLYTSKSGFRDEKNNCGKNIERYHSRHFCPDTYSSESWGHNSPLTSAEEEPQITKAVGVNGFLRNRKKNSHLLQSTPLYTTSKMDGIEKGKVIQPEIPAVKSYDALDRSAKSKTVSQHVNLNIDGCERDEISVKIKQSFSTLNNLESDIDKAAHFLQASFSNRVSISSMFDCAKMEDESFSKRCILENRFSNNDHLFSKQNAKDVTRGKTLGCRLKAHIAYGRKVAEMSQHLRDVRDAFGSQRLLHENEVGDSRDSPSNERCFDRQSSFYATVQQRMNKALQHNSFTNNMYKLSQYPLKERNCDPIDLPISSFSKIDAVQDYNDDDDDGTKSEIRSAESEVTPQTVVQQAKSSDVELLNESPSTHSVLNDITQSDEVNSSQAYSSRELLKREYYANNTVKALRQFYSDSMLYFVRLRKLYCQQKVENLWKVDNEEERIKAACLLLKRKYIDTVHSAMPLKNLVDYHLHETARIQLLNLDLQKHLRLLRGIKKDSNFEKFRHGSEKVLLWTKDFEKNNLANELERWELKLRTRSRGLKNYDDLAANIDNIRPLFSTPFRVVRNIQEGRVRNPTSYKKNLEQLREELKWKRREADFLKRTFDQRVMRNDQSEENSLRAQIDAHVRYITETEKDIAQLIKLQNGNDDNNEQSFDVPTASYEGYPISSSKLTSMGISAERTFSDGRFSETDKSRTSFSADIHSANKFCDSERDPKKGNIESSQFSKLTLEEESGADSVSERCKNLPSSEKTHDTCHSIELSSISTLTSQRLTSDRLSEHSLNSNYVEESCSTSNETPLSTDKKLSCSQVVSTISKDPAHLLIDSPGSIHSTELIYNATASLKQDTSKEALLISVPCRSDTSYSQVEEQEQSAVQPGDTIDENETDADRHNLPSSFIDEEFFTPLPSDIETDNEEKGDDGIEEDTITSQESSSSFHTTVSSPTPDVPIDSKITQISLPTSPKLRKFKLTVSPLPSSRSPASARYAASMPREDNSRSITDSPRTSKAEPSRCISPLSASLLESLLEDSLTTMLTLAHNRTLGDETFVLPEDHNQLPANSAALPTDNSWQSDQSYDLNKIPVPEDLIPVLDLSGVNNTEAEAITEENDFPSKLKGSNSSVEIRSDLQISSPKFVSSPQFRYYLSDEKWAAAEIHSVSEQIWNLASSKQPLEIVVSDDPSRTTSQEVQMRQMIADRCCEIAKRCFKDVGRGRYMGLTNINCSRPRNLLHLESILQKQLSKYYQKNKWDGKERKRWESLSRGRNSDIENIVLEELYAEQDSWEDVLENYEDEIKTELIAELWNEQLDESLLTAINV